MQLLLAVVAKTWANRPPEMIWAVLGLTISHGISFVENYVVGGEYKTGSLKKLMHQPYQRILVMHLAILAGGILVLQLNSPLPLLIVLIGLKITVDLYLHRKSHKKTTDRRTVERQNPEVPESV